MNDAYNVISFICTWYVVAKIGYWFAKESNWSDKTATVVSFLAQAAFFACAWYFEV